MAAGVFAAQASSDRSPQNSESQVQAVVSPGISLVVLMARLVWLEKTKMRMNQNNVNAKYNTCSGICLGDIAAETF